MISTMRRDAKTTQRVTQISRRPSVKRLDDIGFCSLARVFLTVECCEIRSRRDNHMSIAKIVICYVLGNALLLGFRCFKSKIKGDRVLWYLTGIAIAVAGTLTVALLVWGVEKLVPQPTPADIWGDDARNATISGSFIRPVLGGLGAALMILSYGVGAFMLPYSWIASDDRRKREYR